MVLGSLSNATEGINGLDYLISKAQHVLEKHPNGHGKITINGSQEMSMSPVRPLCNYKAGQKQEH
jgi:hypothetical protein